MRPLGRLKRLETDVQGHGHSNRLVHLEGGICSALPASASSPFPSCLPTFGAAACPKGPFHLFVLSGSALKDTLRSAPHFNFVFFLNTHTYTVVLFICILCVQMFYVHVRLHHTHAWPLKRKLDPLKLELQMAVSCPVSAGNQTPVF